MSQGDGPAVDVEDIAVDHTGKSFITEFFGEGGRFQCFETGQNLYGKGLVDLDGLNVFKAHARFLENLRDGVRRADAHPVRFDAGKGAGPDKAQWF